MKTRKIRQFTILIFYLA